MKPHLRRPASQSGFTLIELAVVLVLIGILTGLAVPSMRSWTSRARLDGALNQLSGDIAFARMLAVRSGPNWSVTLDLLPAGQGYRILKRSPAGVIQEAKRIDLVSEHPSSGIVGMPMPLRFNSRGLLTGNETTTLTVWQQNLSGSLIVLRTGRTYRAD